MSQNRPTDRRPMKRYLSPQARRRFNACLHGGELTDLAAEITDALADINPGLSRPSLLWKEHTQATVEAVLAAELRD